MGIKKAEKWEPWEFENGKIKKSLPKEIVPTDAMSEEEESFRGFLLTLAMIFNDFKGLVLMNDTMQHVYKQTGDEVSGHNGELAGIRLQMIKILYATIHEALVFLGESEQICASKLFQQLVQKTSDGTQLVWEMLRKIANGQSTDDERFKEFEELREFLVKARNNVGFHYQTRKQLIAGFRRFFEKGITGMPETSRQWAYRSTKSEFNQSRYYYADAALQGYYVNLFGDEKSNKERNDETFRLLNLIVYAIHDLLRQYYDALPAH